MGMGETLLIKNIRRLYGIAQSGLPFKKGKAMSEVETIENAFLLTQGKSIQAYGSMAQCPERADTVIDADGKCVLPAWCDSHTHIVFAQGREGEYVDKLKGISYEQIAAKGGGILNSAKKLQELPEDILYERALGRLNEVISNGTGAIEIKSGYGLTIASELKMLRVIQRLKESSEATIKATFLGAHAIPPEYKDNRKGYIDLIIDKMLPQISEEKLADYCDVFCEKGFFTVEETDQILKAGVKYGLKPKIHANQLNISGGVQVGIANHAVSVDHLEAVGQEELDALKHTDTIPTVLPSCSFFLNIPYAPARKMIDQGLGIAMATDFNPGSSPSGNIPLLMALACNPMRLLPAEVFNAVTINGAYAMELGHSHGAIEAGRVANLIITRSIPSLDYMIYSFGSSHIDQVILNGKIVR
jgi:imidazolonepropionase